MFAKNYICAFGLLALTSTAAFASDPDGKFSVRGIGGQPCSLWISVSEGTDETQKRDGVLAFQSWLAGYLSASNRLQAESYDVLPFLDMINVLAIVLNECRAVPNELVENTMARVVGAFANARVTAESPIINVTDAGVEKPYRQATIALAQQKLVDLGYLDGVPDGVIGPASTDALALYQSENGLPSTGEMSVDTMFKLLLQ